MNSKFRDEQNLTNDEMAFIVDHETIKKELNAVVEARKRSKSSNIVLSAAKTTVDSLTNEYTLTLGEDDVVYVSDSKGEEVTFLLHGVVGHALLPTQDILRNLKNNVGRICHRLLIIGSRTGDFVEADAALKKLSQFVVDMRPRAEFVSSPREYSAYGFPAICVEAPLLTDKSKITEDIAIKESIDVPKQMDPSGYLEKFIKTQLEPRKFVFTDDNWVSYYEVPTGSNAAGSALTDIVPDDLRVGHVVEVGFSVRGVRIRGGKRVVKNHISSVTILSRKGLPLLSEKKATGFPSAPPASTGSEKTTNIPKKRRRVDPVDLGVSDGHETQETDEVTKAIKRTRLQDGAGAGDPDVVMTQ